MKENKKRMITLALIGLAVLVLTVIGSAFAYFSIVNSSNSSTSTSYTGITEDMVKYGNSYFTGGIEGYHLQVNVSDMAPTKIGTHYYGTTDPDSNYNLERKNYELSRVSIQGGVNNENIEYTCTSELVITLDGNLTDRDVLQEGDGTLYLSGSNLKIDKRQIDLKKLIDESDTIEEGKKQYKKELTYVVSKENDGILTVDFEILNRNAYQNDIAGKNINITIDNNNLQCEASGKKVYAYLEGYNSYYKSNTYKNNIVSASFVDYVPSDTELNQKEIYWDLTKKSVYTPGPASPAKSVIGWLEPTLEDPQQYNLYIGSKDSIYVTNLEGAFEAMSNLKEINFDNLNTSETINMGSMFFGCTNLTTLDLSRFNTSQVTDMSYMFDFCNNLTELDLSSFDTSQVTDMQSMFLNIKADLPFKDWPGFVTSNVENMFQMFSSYKGTKLDLSTFDTSKVTNMNGLFVGCRNLIELDLSNFTFDNVTEGTDNKAGTYQTFMAMPKSCQVKIKSSQQAIFEKKFPLNGSAYQGYRTFTPTYVD